MTDCTVASPSCAAHRFALLVYASVALGIHEVVGRRPSSLAHIEAVRCHQPCCQEHLSKGYINIPYMVLPSYHSCLTADQRIGTGPGAAHNQALSS